MKRFISFLVCIGFFVLSSLLVSAQTNNTAGDRDSRSNKMPETYSSSGNISVPSENIEQDSIDAALPKTINKLIVYRASVLDDQSSSQIIAYERAKREIIEELKNDVTSLYYRECELNNDEALLASEDIITLMAPLLYVERNREKWEEYQLQLEASATVSSFAIAKTLYILSKQEMLLKHIKKNHDSADHALTKIGELQDLPEDDNKKTQEIYRKTVNLLYSIQMFEQALLSGLAGEVESAIDAYSEALELNPEFSEAFYYRGSHYYSHLKNNRKALSDFNNAIKLDDSEASYYISRGLCYYDINNLELAIRDFNRAIDLVYPASYLLFRAFALRGNAYEKKGEDREALQDYTRAIEINPEAVNIYYRRGLVNRNLKNYEESVEDFCNVIELDKKHSDAYHERGVTYAFLGDKQKVLDDFKTAARLGNTEAREFLSSKNIEWEE
jgi:tetratricopeptide (TPR) repeat protein